MQLRLVTPYCWALCALATIAAADVQITARYSEDLGEVSEDLAIAEDIHFLEQARTDNDDGRDDIRFTIRSRHFIFGMPRLVDDRYRLGPKQAGVSLLVRDGFVVAYLEGMRSPLWVCQRWTRDELKEDKQRIPGLDRDWRKDPDLPLSTQLVHGGGNALPNSAGGAAGGQHQGV